MLLLLLLLLEAIVSLQLVNTVLEKANSLPVNVQDILALSYKVTLFGLQVIIFSPSPLKCVFTPKMFEMLRNFFIFLLKLRSNKIKQIVNIQGYRKNLLHVRLLRKGLRALFALNEKKERG